MVISFLIVTADKTMVVNVCGELETTFKESVMPHLENYISIYLEDQRKTSG